VEHGEETGPEAEAATAQRPDVFISYSRKDRDVVDVLVARLLERGKDVWIDRDDIPPATEWKDRIRRGIETTRAFVFALRAYPGSCVDRDCKSSR